jgi:hypothetical protein
MTGHDLYRPCKTFLAKRTLRKLHVGVTTSKPVEHHAVGSHQDQMRLSAVRGMRWN